MRVIDHLIYSDHFFSGLEKISLSKLFKWNAIEFEPNIVQIKPNILKNDEKIDVSNIDFGASIYIYRFVYEL